MTLAARQLRPYQTKAIAAWEQQNRRGILAMATGTGKTFTSLVCIERTIANSPGLSTVVVVAPFQHLADQWAEEMERVGMRPVRAYDTSAIWLTQLSLERAKATVREKPLYVLTTYATLGGEHLVRELAPFADSLLLVADECHYLGSPRTRPFMGLPVAYRLGLSATPQRHFDDVGTKSLADYFDGVVFEFGLGEAVQAGFLTPYDYHPEPVELTDEEFDAYRVLTTRIGRAMAMASKNTDTEALQKLLLARARLLNNAENKLAWLSEKLQGKTHDEMKYTLVYAGERLFKKVTKLIGRELGIPVHAFTSEQSRRERAKLLQRFQSGELSVLVAMRCLDEGVDVPPTRTAYFLASSSNPREFVQRRGRILRTSPGKSSAIIYDAIAVPPAAGSFGSLDASERATIRSQFNRIREFSQQARNAVEADKAMFHLRLLADLPAVSAVEEGDES